MRRWDIFCKVVDNYGDVGVCWRLARQLAAEHGVVVRLFLDDVSALATIWPEFNPNLDGQMVAGVTVLHWADASDWSNMVIADVVVEGFACGLPEPYVQAMLAQKKSSGASARWANLEYLSAEAWVAGCHLLDSPQASGLTKTFFFPGFTNQTGGLLREANIKAEVPPEKYYGEQGDALKISLFGYEAMPLKQWLPCLVNTPQTTVLAVTSGKASAAMRAAWQELGYDGEQQGALTLRYLPMLTQLEFDELLQVSDVNFVRGEDSLVRAIWAERVLTWHIYPQDDGVHMDKLSAFSTVYGGFFEQSHQNDLREVFDHWQMAWNGDVRYDLAQAWAAFRTHLPLLVQGAHEVASGLRQTEDLAQQLLRWSESSR